MRSHHSFSSRKAPVPQGLVGPVAFSSGGRGCILRLEGGAGGQEGAGADCGRFQSLYLCINTTKTY